MMEANGAMIFLPDAGVAQDPFGRVLPADGGPPVPPEQAPVPVQMSFKDLMVAANPLQYVPVVGTIYRAVTGESAPVGFQVAGAVATGAVSGSFIGALGTALIGLVTELVRLGPDTSRPPAPMGMQVGDAEAGVEPVTPGQPTEPGGYTTLATTLPQFLGAPLWGPSDPAGAARAYASIGDSWAIEQAAGRGRG
jgi:hypothetical protein